MTRFRSTPAWRLALITVLFVSATTLARTPIESAAGWVAETPPVRAVGAAVRATGRTVLPARTRRILKRAMGSPSPSPAPTIAATKAAVIQNDVDADGRADPGDTIRYTVTITNSGITPGVDDATGVQVSDTIDAHTTLVGGSIIVSPLANGETYTSIGNMTLTSASLGGTCAANARRSVTCNDLPAGITLVGFGATQGAANGTVVNGTNSVTTSNNGTVLLNTDGTFVYNPAAGFEGTDSFWYTVSNAAGTDNAQVSITVGGANGMVWFVNSTGAAGTGTQASPFNSLSAFNTVNNGTGTNPAAGDTVILLENATAYTGPVTLLNTQKLIGQDATVSVPTLGGPALPSNGAGGTPTAGNAYPATNPTAATVSITSAGVGITLALDNRIAGFTVGNATTAITGTAAGALRVREVTINTNGAGLIISTSAAIPVDATFPGFTSITATGGTNGVSLTGVTGTLALGGGALSASTGATFNVSGGSVAISYSGNITQGNNAALVSVSGSHTGTLTFTGTLSANNGSGLQFSTANGTYNFNGTTTLNGGNAGIDIINTSIGTFSFGTGTTITNPTPGSAFLLAGSNANVTYSGSISANNLFAVDIDNHDAGTLTFQTGTITSTGTGIRVSNSNGGTINFNSVSMSLTTGTNKAVTLDTANTGGTIIFNHGATGNGLDISTTTGVGFSSLGGGTISVLGSGNTINASTGTALDVENTTIGALGLTFDSTTAGGGTNGVKLASVGGGAVSLGTGSIAGTSGSAFLVGDGAGTANTGGTVAITYGGTITSTGTARAVDIQDRQAGAGNITLSGVITHSTGNASVILLDQVAAGTITFSGANSVANGGTSNAVNLTNNTGATINFTGGGLNIDTTSGVGFNATGGGTITVQGANNVIDSTTGIALNVANTTIGASGLAFVHISSNGAANGIVLNNTGSTGSLTVSGAGGTCTSSATCTGGAILNATIGISLTSTTSPSFDRMFIQTTVDSSVKGTTVTNFTFTNGRIDNSGTGLGAETSNIAFNTTAAGTENNLSGNVTITGNTLTNAYYHGIDIFNFNGTITNANLSNNTVTSSTAGGTAVPCPVSQTPTNCSKGIGIRFIAFGSATTIANVTTATIANNVVSNFPAAAGIMAQGGNGNAAGPLGTFGTAGSGTNIIAITGNRVAGASATNRIGTQAIIAVVNGRGQGNFNIQNNGTVALPITNVAGNGIAVSAFGNANVTATVTDNVIVANNINASAGIGAATSRTFGGTDTPTLTVSIKTNTISQTDGNGILATARDATGHLNVTIRNNNVAAPLSGFRNGIRVDAGNPVQSINDSVCLDIAGNVTAGTGHTNAGIGLRKEGTSSTTNAFGIEGMAATASPGVEQFVGNTGQNPGSENGTAGDGSVNGVIMISSTGTSGFSNCSAAPALNQPAAPVYVARANAFLTHPLSAWSRLQTEVSSAFGPVARTIEPNSPSYVATSATSNVARRTPTEETGISRRSVFASARERTVSALSVPLAKIHDSASEVRRAVAAATAELSVARAEAVADAAVDAAAGLRRHLWRFGEDVSNLFVAELAASGETVNQSVGTVPAAKTVKVVFDVIVDNASAVQYSNQASVSGSNFSTVTTNTVTTPSGTPSKLVITAVNGGVNPTAGTGFSVVVRSQDAASAFAPVTTDTAITLSRNTGTGTLGGTLTGTITAGTSTVTISGVTYTKAESGVSLTATRTSGDVLAAGNSAAFTVNAGVVTQYVLTPATTRVIADVADRITIQPQDANNNPTTGSATVTITGRNVADTADNPNVQVDADKNGTFGDVVVNTSAGAATFDVKNAVVESFKVKGSDGTNSGVSATITTYPLATAGQVVISELRFRGLAGVNDEYINFYNNTDSDMLVGTNDGSAGWAVVAADGVTRFTIPNGVLLPPRSWYLAVNNAASGFSLGSYPAGTGGGTVGAGDIQYNVDIPSSGTGAGVALFRSSTVLNLGNRLDAAGYSTTDPLYHEGAGFPAGGAEQTGNLQYAFARDPITGMPKDTDANETDFISLETTGAATGLGQHLGDPSPHTMASPLRRSLVTVTAIPAVPTTVRDNRNFTWNIPGGGTLNFPIGVMSVPKRFTNNTGQAVTRLRVRIVNMTTLPSGAGVADLRAIDATGTVTDSAGTTVVAGLRPMLVEMPSIQPNGGGLNATLTLNLSGLPGGALANGATVDVHMLLGVKQTGTFRFFIMMEALP